MTAADKWMWLKNVTLGVPAMSQWVTNQTQVAAQVTMEVRVWSPARGGEFKDLVLPQWQCTQSLAQKLPCALGAAIKVTKKCYFTQRARNATCPHKYTYISSKNAVQLLGYTVLVFKIYIQKYIRTHFGFYNLATHFFRFLASYLLKGVKSLRAEI